MWRPVDVFERGRAPPSLQAQQIAVRCRSYEWVGRGRPDPGQLPDGFAQSDADPYKACRRPSRAERLVHVTLLVAFAWLGLLVWQAV